MKVCALLVVILSIALAGNAGTYELGCTDGLFGSGSGQTKAKVTCGLNGYVSKISVTTETYDATKCAGKVLLKSVYSVSAVPQEQKNKTDTTYTLTTSKVTVRSDDVATLTKGCTCVPAMKEGKTYSITDITCDTTGIIKVDLFLVQRSMLESSSSSRIAFADNKMRIYSSAFSGSYTKTSTWGSIWWTILIVVVVVIVVVAIVCAVLAVLCKKKTLKKATKK